MTRAATALGIDLATAGARCVALDARNGAVLASARRELPRPVRREGGHSRQSAAYGDVALRLISEVCSALPSSAPPVRAVSVTGTSGTVVAGDVHGRPLSDARLYDDTKASALLEREGILRAPTLGRARLLLDEFPDAQLMTTADVALSALAGRLLGGDTSHWLKAGLDLVTKDFEPTLLGALGLSRDRLPSLVVPGTVVGTVATALASRLGLPSGVLLVAGMTDGCTAQISTGAVHEGDTMGVLGTTLVMKAVSTCQVSTLDGAVYSHLGPDGRFWPGGASNSGGGVLSREFRGDPAALDTPAARRGPSTIVRYPLTRPGERFPLADPAMTDLRSAPPVDEVDAYRAVLDGVSLVERLGLERLAALGVASRRHILTGGGSRSAVWNSIRAALVSRAVSPGGGPAVVLVRGAGSVVGAALLAIAGATAEPLTTVVDRLVPTPAPVLPDERTSSAADDLWNRFRRLLADSGHDLAGGATPTIDRSTQEKEHR